jgi:hypothetical protein
MYLIKTLPLQKQSLNVTVLSYLDKINTSLAAHKIRPHPIRPVLTICSAFSTAA